MKKAVLAIVLASICTFSFIGCGGSKKVSVETKSVENGANTSTIGKSGITYAKYADVTDEYLQKWYDSVKNKDLNWAVIIYKDKGNNDFGVFFNNSGFIEKDVTLEKQSDGTYMLGDSSKETMYTIGSDGKLSSK